MFAGVARARAPSARAAPRARRLRLPPRAARARTSARSRAGGTGAAAVLDRDERLLDETRERVCDRHRLEAVARADLFTRLQLEAAGEDREPAEQQLLVRLEEVVAPLERRGQRLLPRRRRMAAAAQQAEAVVEPGGDRRGAQRSEPGSGELERERQAVEAKTDPGDVLGVLLVELEARRGRDRALRRRARRTRSRAARVAEAAARDQGCASEGTRKTTSPGTRSGSRLVARIVSCGAARSNASASAAVAASRCSQLSSTSSSSRAREKVDHGRDQLLRGQRPDIERGRDRVRDESWVGDGCELDERGTRRVRGLDRARELEREPRLPDAAGARQASEHACAGAANPAPRALALGRRTSSHPRAGRTVPSCRAPPTPPRARRPAPRALRDAPRPSRRSGSPAAARRGRATSTARYAAGCLHPPRIRGRQLEQVDVDVDVSRKRQHLVADVDRVRAECAPRDVHRLMQVVRGRSRRELAPEHVECLVAMQTMAACESEQLHELARLLQAPRGVGHDDTVDRRLETPEQLDADSHRTNLTRGTRVAAIRARR